MRISGPNREEVVGGRRRLHKGELRNFCFSLNDIGMIKSRRMKWSGHVGRMGDMRNEWNILVGKPERKRTFGRPRRRCNGNRMDLREIGWEVVGWIRLAQDRDQWRADVKTTRNLWV